MTLVRLTVLLLALGSAMPLPAAGGDELDIRGARIVATVPGQRATAGYMQFTSATAARLLAAGSPVAGAVEFHTMSMSDDIMRMRQVGFVDLPAGKTVELSASGTHLMFRDLQHPLRPGDSVELSLTVSGPSGGQRVARLRVPVVERGAGKDRHQ